MSTFVNEARPVTKKKTYYYGFYPTPRLLFSWSKLFQNVISQTGTYLLTNKFHDGECGIYKCEGGCRISGKGDLVLLSDMCYWDHGNPTDKDSSIGQMADLITHIVLNWNPTDPVNSMLNAAGEFLSTQKGDLETAEYVSKIKQVLEGTNRGPNPFGGNALSSFFDWNPFSKPPINREYHRFCLINFSRMTNEEVDQKYADEDLGEQLMKEVNKAIQERHDGYVCTLMCCFPRRFQDGKLGFWCNTGRSTQVDGHQTEESLRKFIASGEKLVDRMK